jgi:hypothetical protein
MGTLKNDCVFNTYSTYFYQTTPFGCDWYDNYRNNALLTSYDHKKKGIDH